MHRYIIGNRYMEGEKVTKVRLLLRVDDKNTKNNASACRVKHSLQCPRFIHVRCPYGQYLTSGDGLGMGLQTIIFNINRSDL